MIYKGSTPVYPVKGDGSALTVKKGNQLIWSNLFGTKEVYEKSYEAGHYTQKTATGMRFKCFGEQILKPEWVLDHLKTSTTYKATCTLKYLSGPPEGFNAITYYFKDLRLSAPGKQVLMLSHRRQMTVDEVLKVTTTFTTPETLDGFAVYAYSEQWHNESGEQQPAEIELQKLCIAEQTGVEEVTTNV